LKLTVDSPLAYNPFYQSIGSGRAQIVDLTRFFRRDIIYFVYKTLMKKATT